MIFLHTDTSWSIGPIQYDHKIGLRLAGHSWWTGGAYKPKKPPWGGLCPREGAAAWPSEKSLVIRMEGNSHCAAWLSVSQICLLAKTAMGSCLSAVESRRDVHKKSRALVHAKLHGMPGHQQCCLSMALTEQQSHLVIYGLSTQGV